MTQLSKQAEISREIRAALIGGDSLSTIDLVPLCGTAEDAVALSRVVYSLRQNGLIAEDPTPGPYGRNGKPTKRWRWIGPADEPAPTTVKYQAKRGTAPVEPVEPAADPEPVVAPHIPMEEVAEMLGLPSATAQGCDDPIEFVLADLVDQLDDSLMGLADTLLAGNMVWTRMRSLSSDAFALLCDYRLARSLENNHE